MITLLKQRRDIWERILEWKAQTPFSFGTKNNPMGISLCHRKQTSLWILEIKLDSINQSIHFWYVRMNEKLSFNVPLKLSSCLSSIAIYSNQGQ